MIADITSTATEIFTNVSNKESIVQMMSYLILSSFVGRFIFIPVETLLLNA